MYLLPPSIIEDRQRQRAEADPLLDDNPMRFVTLPIHFHRVWGAYKAHEAHFWTAEDVDVSGIESEVAQLPEELRHAILGLLTNDATTIFGNNDTENNQGISEFKLDKCAATMALTSDLQIPEGRSFYGFQASYENILLELQSIALYNYYQEDATRMDAALMEMSVRKEAVKRGVIWHRHVWGENELGLTEVGPSFSERVLATGVMKQVNTLGHRVLLAHITSHYPAMINSSVVKILEHTIETAQRHLAFNAMISKSLVNPTGKQAANDLLQLAIEAEREFLLTVFKGPSADLIPEALLTNEKLALGACFHLGGPSADLKSVVGDCTVVHPVLNVEADEMVINNEDTKQTGAEEHVDEKFTINNDDSDF